MTKKWKVSAIYQLVDKTGFLENAEENKQLLPYVSEKFKVLELDESGNVVSVEDIYLTIVSKRSGGIILSTGERKFFKRVKD